MVPWIELAGVGPVSAERVSFELLPIIPSKEANAGDSGGAGGNAIRCIGGGHAAQGKDWYALRLGACPAEDFESLGLRGKFLENRGEEQQIHMFCNGHPDIVQVMAGNTNHCVATTGAKGLPDAPGHSRCGFPGEMHAISLDCQSQVGGFGPGDIDQQLRTMPADPCQHPQQIDGQGLKLMRIQIFFS